MDISKLKNLFFEFARYILVGGGAFLIDFGVLIVFKEYILPHDNQISLYVATALGFIAGLIFNYILSLMFVFTSAKEKIKGRSISAFIVFCIIGLIGLGLTELGMYLGTDVFKIYYQFVKIFVTAIVLIWNYGARKVFIFK